MGAVNFPTKTAEVNYDYDTYIAGGFAPLPVSPFATQHAGLFES